MSDYYLCPNCESCDLGEFVDFYHLACDEGETEPKVMHDYGPASSNPEHIDGYRSPFDVCPKYRPRRES